MKTFIQSCRLKIKNYGLKDKYIITIVSAVALVTIFTLITFNYLHRFEKEKKTLNTQLREVQELRMKLLKIKDVVESREKKIGLTKVAGAVPALEQMLNSIGIKAKTIKTLKKKRIKEFTEEDAEVEIDGLDLNKIVNILYKIEHSPVPIKVKRVNIKTTFEDPNVFILTFTASLISKV